MSIWGVIPARYGSTRFPGKPLTPILGLELLAWVIRGAKTSKLLDKVLVATDDWRIAKLAQREGVEAIMTDSHLPSGSDRVWVSVQEQSSLDVVLNIQGDEPLIQGELIDSLLHPMIKDPYLEMATLAHSISPEELISEHSVKVILNQRSEAIYFSRYAIPYSRKSAYGQFGSITGVLKHIGMYAYRRSFLMKYCQQPPVEIELAESLEQLRALYLGARIKVVTTDQKSLGVDTPQDVAIVEDWLTNEGNEDYLD